MRVRQWAVVGAALATVWAGGSGMAQAGEGETTDPACQLLPATSEGEAPVAPENCPTPTPTPDPSEDDAASLAVTGDCLDPETFTFTVTAQRLEVNTKYTILVGSDDFEIPEGSEADGFTSEFTTDESGNYTGSFPGKEGDVIAPDTAFSVYYFVVTSADLATGAPDATFLQGTAHVAECAEVPPTTPPTTDHPTEQPGTSTPPTSSAPTTTAPATTTPVAAPIAVSPAGAHPAVLANTGSPVTSAALLGGGLLVAGAGALVATRRRKA